MRLKLKAPWPERLKTVLKILILYLLLPMLSRFGATRLNDYYLQHTHPSTISPPALPISNFVLC